MADPRDALLGTRGEHYFVRSTCRLCGSGRLTRVLELEPTPPANEFRHEQELGIPQQCFPLGLWQCGECGHVQLPVVVDPARLFRNYVYVSGTSPVFVNHFRGYAESVTQRLSLAPGSLVVDVGSNDGTLLGFFQQAGMRALGIDPARDIAAAATARGVETLPEFLDEALAERIVAERGPAKLVTANNVFAHIDDLRAAALAVRRVLADDGAFVFEVYYLVDFCDKMLFDTVYHEHLSYHSLGALVPFLDSVGLRIFDVERVPTHGGSIRVYADKGRRNPTHAIDDLLALEHARGHFVPGKPASSLPNPLVSLEARIVKLGDALGKRLGGLRAEGRRIAGYGAPAKATTLMHQFNLGREQLDFIVDDSPLKQGLYTPGKEVPVLASTALAERKPDYLLLLAWNFAESIIDRCAEFRAKGGKIIVPLPELVEC